MNRQDGIAFLKRIISETTNADGSAAVDSHPTLRHVDSKVREVRVALQSMDGVPKPFLVAFNDDIDFEANSRRVRLEALANYCSNVLRLFDAKVQARKPQITRIPDISKLAGALPGLEGALARRWLDAQKCVHQKMYLVAIILMGSILEGLILARVSRSPSVAY